MHGCIIRELVLVHARLPVGHVLYAYVLPGTRSHGIHRHDLLRVTRTHNRNTRESLSAIYYNTNPRMHRTQGMAGWQISVISPGNAYFEMARRVSLPFSMHFKFIIQILDSPDWLTCCKMYISVIPHCLTFYIKINMDCGKSIRQDSNGIILRWCNMIINIFFATSSDAKKDHDTDWLKIWDLA